MEKVQLLELHLGITVNYEYMTSMSPFFCYTKKRGRNDVTVQVPLLLSLVKNYLFIYKKLSYPQPEVGFIELPNHMAATSSICQDAMSIMVSPFTNALIRQRWAAISATAQPINTELSQDIFVFHVPLFTYAHATQFKHICCTTAYTLLHVKI